MVNNRINRKVRRVRKGNKGFFSKKIPLRAFSVLSALAVNLSVLFAFAVTFSLQLLCVSLRNLSALRLNSPIKLSANSFSLQSAVSTLHNTALSAPANIRDYRSLQHCLAQAHKFYLHA